MWRYLRCILGRHHERDLLETKEDGTYCIRHGVWLT